MPSKRQDPPSQASRRIRAEFRRVGVIDSEIKSILLARRDALLQQHPELREQFERTLNGDPDSFGWVVNGEIAMEALGALPANAGTAAFLANLDRLTKERGWDLFGTRQADA